MSDYHQFIEGKKHTGSDGGFAPLWMPDFLFPFQAAKVEWAIRKGRAANVADCMWDDIRFNRVLPYREARDSEDEKHVHPLQLDVIERCVVLRSNPGEVVLTPFMGVGSEVYIPVLLGRKGIGAELKPSYFRQAVKNVQMASEGRRDDEQSGDLFEALEQDAA